ncbi:MAG: 2-oxoglutarate and iron-dependent oxygenase domain-containing protein [Acidimicrobiia bacterium]
MGAGVHIHEIDLQGFREGGPHDRDAVAREFDHAGSDNGFIRLVGHGVDWALVEAAFAAWQEFFDLPLGDKLPYRAGPEADGMVGYTPYGQQALAYTAGEESPPDLLEAYSVGREDLDGAFLAEYRAWFPDNIWPSLPAGLRGAVDALEAELSGVADTVLRAMALALDLPETWFVAKAERAVVTTRCNHYLRGAGVAPQPGQPGLGGHTDYGMITLLVADPVPGLQVLGDGEWHDLIPPAGTITCNLGDMLAMWTNDRWVSTMHRVAPPAGIEGEVRRRSIARFLDGDPSVHIAAIPSCVAPGETPRYPEVNAGEWLMAKVVGGQAGEPVALHDGGLTGATNR